MDVKDNGYFIISLDFELMWGVRDVHSINSYGDAVLKGRDIFIRTLNLFEDYRVKSTIATVGFLFCENKKQLFQKPSLLPTYGNSLLNPYLAIDEVGSNEDEDPYYYAKSIINTIKDLKSQEIATHTFSHFYCLEKGQTVLQFEADLKKAISIAKESNINI